MKIGFVGLGQMGSPMARNLVRAGHQVIVYNRSREKAAAIEGAQIADSPAAAARESEVIFTMLADDRAVEDTVFGDQGIAAGLRTGSIHVSSSTISTALARRMAAVHVSRNQGFVGAPVFGRPDAAEAKRLVVVAAGS